MYEVVISWNQHVRATGRTGFEATLLRAGFFIPPGAIEHGLTGEFVVPGDAECIEPSGDGAQVSTGGDDSPAISYLLGSLPRAHQAEATIIGSDNACGGGFRSGPDGYGLTLNASDLGWTVRTRHGSLEPDGHGGATADPFKVEDIYHWQAITFDGSRMIGKFVLTDRDGCTQTDDVSLIWPDSLYEFFSQLPVHGSCPTVTAEVTASSTPDSATRDDPVTGESATGKHLLAIEVVDSGLAPGIKVEGYYSVSDETHFDGFWHGVVQADGSVVMEIPVEATGFTFVMVADLGTGCTLGNAQIE